MAKSNPLWGAPRVHGEIIKLGIDISERTVSRWMPRRTKPPSQNWRAFLDNHIGELVSMDFFTVPTATFRVLFVLIVLAHDRGWILRSERVGATVGKSPETRKTGQPGFWRSTGWRNASQYRATQYLSSDSEAAPLVIGEQDAFLTELLFEYLVIAAQVLEGLLLMPVDPAGEDEEQQLLRLQSRFHTSPDAVRRVVASEINNRLSTARKSDCAVHRRIVVIGTYGSAEFLTIRGYQVPIQG